MFVFLPPRVSSRVSGFPVASPCLWGKLQNLSYSKVSKPVVMSFCVAGLVLCDIPNCLITCRKCQTERKSRKKCSFFCVHVSRPESLVFLWRRCVYGGSCKTSPFWRFPSRLSCRFARQVWHFVTFQPVLYTPHSTLHSLHFTLHTLHSTLYTPHFTLYTLHSTLQTSHSTLYTLHSLKHHLYLKKVLAFFLADYLFSARFICSKKKVLEQSAPYNMQGKFLSHIW